MTTNSQTDSKTSILLADDDPVVRMLISASLAPAGFMIREAANGREALESFLDFPADIVLLDVLMPEMDGFEACKRLRDSPRGRDIPIVMITGLDDNESIEHAYQIGATHFITKPINWMIFPHNVSYILRASRAFSTLKESEQRYALAAHATNDGIWDWNVETNQVYYSPRWKKMLGFEIDEIGSATDEWIGRIHPNDQTRIKAVLNAYLSGESDELHCEYRIRSA